MESSNPLEHNFSQLIAQAPPADGGVGEGEYTFGEIVLNFRTDLDLWMVLTNIINFLLGVGVLLSIIFLVVGGIGFITATGNKEKAKTATETIKWAIIGLVLILGFGLFLNLFTGLFTPESGTPPSGTTS